MLSKVGKTETQWQTHTVLGCLYCQLLEPRVLSAHARRVGTFSFAKGRTRSVFADVGGVVVITVDCQSLYRSV